MNNLFNLGADTDPRGSPNDLPFKNRKMEEGHAGAKVSFKALKAGMRQSPIRNPNIQNPAMHVGFDFQPVQASLNAESSPVWLPGVQVV